MDSFLACHDVFLGNKWAVSAARGNGKDAATAGGGAAIELLAVKPPEIALVRHSSFPLLLFTHYIFFYFCFTSSQQVQ